MSNGGASGASGAAVAAGTVIAQATKASGAILRVKPEDFKNLVNLEEKPLVAVCEPRWLRRYYQYLAGVRGLIFYARSPAVLHFKPRTMVVEVQKIWIPH